VYSRTKSNYTLTVYYDPGKLEWGIPPTTSLAVTDNFTSPNYADALPTRKTDTLTSIERLEFADVGIAYDLAGNAGTTAKIIGAVFGAATLANKNYVGIGLDRLDGGMSYENLMQLALDVKLGANASNAAVVTLLYTNLVGTAPTATAMAYYKGLLDAGSFSQAGLAVHAADLPHNAANIGLVGLASTGIEYV
jgi:serralysin